MELEIMSQGGKRESGGLSNKMLRLLKEVVEETYNYQAMYVRMDKLKSNYELLYLEEMLSTYKERGKLIERASNKLVEEGKKAALKQAT